MDNEMLRVCVYVCMSVSVNRTTFDGEIKIYIYIYIYIQLGKCQRISIFSASITNRLFFSIPVYGDGSQELNFYAPCLRLYGSTCICRTGITSCRQEAATICPTPVRAARCGPAPAHTRLACGAQRALLPVAMGAMNIHDVRDRRQTDVTRQTDRQNGQTSDKSIA